MARLLDRMRSPAVGPVALFLLPFVVYGRFIAGDELYNADVFLAYRPAHAWLAEGLRHGHVPLWTDAILGGFPIAFSEYGWFSPLNWLPLIALGGHAGYYAAAALNVGLASVAAYALARDLDASPLAAMLAGVVYSQSLFVAGGAPLLNQGPAYGALPAALLAVRWGFAGRAGAAPVLGLIVALTLLGSHPQLAIVALAPPALCALWLGLRGPRRAPLLTLGGGGALGAMVCALRYLPTLPMVAASERAGGLSLDASAVGSVLPHALLAGLLTPSLQAPRYLTPQWSAYVGALPLALALAARGRSRRWLAVLAVAGVVVALGSLTPVFWLLQRTPLLTYFRDPSRFLLWTVLGIALLSAAGLDRVVATTRDRTARAMVRVAVCGVLPVAMAIASTMALRAAESRGVPWILLNTVGEVGQRDFPQEHYAALAARTWLTLKRSVDPRDPALLVPLISLLLASVWWAHFRGRRHGHAIALVCAALPLLAYGQLRLPAVPRGVVSEIPITAQTSSEATTDTPARTLSWLPLAADLENRVQLEGAGLDANVASYRLLKRLLAPNFGLLQGVAQLDGYENLMTREQGVLTAALGSERTSTNSPLALVRQRLPERRRLIGERWGLAEAAAVGVVLSVERLQPTFWPPAARFEPGLVHAERGVPSVTAFRMTRPARRAYVTGSWRTAASADDAARMLAADDMDGIVATVITVGAGDAQIRPRPTAPATFSGGASITRYAEREVELDVAADTDALLVLLDARAPGWTATVSGARAEILTANVAFRAIEIPAGQHRVTFVYTPPYWGASLALSASAAVVLLGWSVRVLARERGRFSRRSPDAGAADR
ncbi:MAG: YfhO family protein [Chloroflexota bacterium]